MEHSFCVLSSWLHDFPCVLRSITHPRVLRCVLASREHRPVPKESATLIIMRSVLCFEATRRSWNTAS